MRHIARETAFQTIYQIDLGNNSPEFALELALEDAGLSQSEAAFCQRLVHGAHEHQAEIDQLLQANTEGWTIERMMSVDRNILRLAMYEILFCEDIPDKVAVNEAIELAKIFGDDNSSKFVNSILDKILKTR